MVVLVSHRSTGTKLGPRGPTLCSQGRMQSAQHHKNISEVKMLSPLIQETTCGVQRAEGWAPSSNSSKLVVFNNVKVNK